MIIIGEKLNGAIPAVKTAITERNAQLIRSRATAQEQAGAHFIDCAPGTAPELEYDAMVWMIGQIQSLPKSLSASTALTPLCLPGFWKRDMPQNPAWSIPSMKKAINAKPSSR